jgi:hypothetical protein
VSEAVHIEMWDCAADVFAQVQGIAETRSMHLRSLLGSQRANDACLDAAGNGHFGEEEKCGAGHAT